MRFRSLFQGIHISDACLPINYLDGLRSNPWYFQQFFKSTWYFIAEFLVVFKLSRSQIFLDLFSNRGPYTWYCLEFFLRRYLSNICI